MLTRNETLYEISAPKKAKGHWSKLEYALKFQVPKVIQKNLNPKPKP